MFDVGFEGRYEFHDPSQLNKSWFFLSEKFFHHRYDLVMRLHRFFQVSVGSRHIYEIFLSDLSYTSCRPFSSEWGDPPLLVPFEILVLVRTRCKHFEGFWIMCFFITCRNVSHKCFKLIICMWCWIHWKIKHSYLFPWLEPIKIEK